MTPRPGGEESCWIISVSCQSFCYYVNNIMNLQLTLIWDHFLFSTFLYKTRKRVITSKWKCLAIKTENWQTQKHGLIIVSIPQTTLSVRLACWSTSSFLIVSANWPVLSLILPSSSSCSLFLAASCLFWRRLSFLTSLLNCLWLSSKESKYGNRTCI